ncbi:MAG: 3-hydroxyacyl-CoA dehydrogenase [Syntrophales bacterium]
MTADDIKRILILGGGTMGQQIAFYFAIHGCEIVIYDIEGRILENALSGIRKMAGSLIKLQQLTQGAADAAMSRISTTTVAEEAAAAADLVSESVPEDPQLKGKVFSLFHTLCPPHTIFTTNTSMLFPSMFARAAGRPEKFLALHFHDLRTNVVVDIMPHPGTDPEVVQIVQDFSKRMNLIAIRLNKENRGYVFNAMLDALMLSAQTLVANEVTSVENVDRAWMGVTHMPMGPFGIMDSIGLDTVWKITDFLAKKKNNKQRQKNADLLKKMIDEGHLGRKSGKGFYSYPGPRYRQPGFVAGL